tara:strand:+ start:3946 stop:4242 length:297 start_codon:yes stop_codon:yes gene_type:complete
MNYFDKLPIEIKNHILDFSYPKKYYYNRVIQELTLIYNEYYQKKAACSDILKYNLLSGYPVWGCHWTNSHSAFIDKYHEKPYFYVLNVLKRHDLAIWD